MSGTMLFPSTGSRSGRDILEDHSIELTVKDIEALRDAPDALPAGKQVSVSYLPGERFDAVVRAASRLRAFGLAPMPHIVARRLRSADELDQQLEALARHGVIDRLFVVAGDVSTAAGPFEDALAVIRTGLLRKHGVRHVGISGYPGGHPGIDADRLWQAMEDKLDALAGQGLDASVITQFFFDADAALEWLAGLRARGIATPVRLGIPGPASVTTLLRFAARCGVEASAKVMARFGFSLTRILKTAGPDRIIDELAMRLASPIHGIAALHFFPFGGLDKTLDWIDGYEAGSRH